MLRGEYESAKDFHKLMPGLIPEPFSFGKYETNDPITYFYLSEFVDMDTASPPDPVDLAAKLAELHKKSQSPNGKFGYHVTTCDGKMPHNTEWEESWAVFFGKLLRRICEIDLRNNGPWPELERAVEQVITKVVPRLLGDLRFEGEAIKPALIHGDLWEPNLGVRADSGDLISMSPTEPPSVSNQVRVMNPEHILTNRGNLQCMISDRTTHITRWTWGRGDVTSSLTYDPRPTCGIIYGSIQRQSQKRSLMIEIGCIVSKAA